MKGEIRLWRGEKEGKIAGLWEEKFEKGRRKKELRGRTWLRRGKKEGRREEKRRLVGREM